MSNILQDMLGMLTRKKVATPKSDDYLVVSRYADPQQVLKPLPKINTELITLKALKTFVNVGGADEYVNAATFDGATDLLTLTRVGGTAITVDMDRKDTKEFVNFTALTVATGATTVINTNSPGQLFLVARTGEDGTGTLQLPPAAGTENWQYRKITITTNGSTSAAKPITLDAQGSETINGGANLVLDKVYASVTIWSDGTNWIVLSSSQVAAV
tara:strand:+ start:157 stop:801 length:645 start_codon:yes stop_codon:yes gene_type:complete